MSTAAGTGPSTGRSAYSNVASSPAVAVDHYLAWSSPPACCPPAGEVPVVGLVEAPPQLGDPAELVVGDGEVAALQTQPDSPLRGKLVVGGKGVRIPSDTDHTGA